MTPMMIFMKESARRSFVTLKTLKVRRIRTVLKALTADLPDPDEVICSTKEIITTTPSKRFIMSLTYSMRKSYKDLEDINKMYLGGLGQ